jgi:hypothetical protein
LLLQEEAEQEDLLKRELVEQEGWFTYQHNH